MALAGRRLKNAARGWAPNLLTCEVQRPAIHQPMGALVYEALTAVHVGGVELCQGDVTACHSIPQGLQAGGPWANVDMHQASLHAQPDKGSTRKQGARHSISRHCSYLLANIGRHTRVPSIQPTTLLQLLPYVVACCNDHKHYALQQLPTCTSVPEICALQP